MNLLTMPKAKAASTPATNNQTWYNLKALANQSAEIWIYDDIGGWGVSSRQFANELKGLGDIKNIELHIHSPGGDVFEGMAIYNLLLNHPAQITVHIDGLAASMASVIAMAGDEICIPENAAIMIHKPWGIQGGDADDMRKYAELLDKVETSLIGAYTRKTGKSAEDIAALLEAETWLFGQEAIDSGFADTLLAPLQAAASFTSNRLKDFEHMPHAMKTLLTPRGHTNQPAPAATVVPPVEPQQPQNEPVNAIAQLQERNNRIRDMFKNHGFPDLMNNCLADVSLTIEQVKDKLLIELGKDATPTNTAGSAAFMFAGNGNIVGDSIRAQLMARAGHAQHEKDNGYSTYNLKELARASLADRGIGVAGLNIMQMVGQAFTHSSSDFGNILLDVANKSVLKGWETQQETYERIAKKGQLSDFKIAHRVGLGEFASLPMVEEGAEYTYGTVGDRGAKIALATYGKIFSLTRQAIINDDMMMLTDVPAKMGKAAKRTIGNLFWAVLTGNTKMGDGKPLFHADHGNLGTGSPSVESLSLLAELMESQEIGEDTLNISPAFALVPPNLKRTMIQIIKSSSIKGADVNAGIANPVQDMVEVISEPRLKKNSDKAWYLAAAQGEDTIEVAFLDGIDTPYIEQMDGFSVDGVATKVRIDAGVAPLDYRGLAKSTGLDK